jgi:hypothetical protein
MAVVYVAALLTSLPVLGGAAVYLSRRFMAGRAARTMPAFLCQRVPGSGALLRESVREGSPRAAHVARGAGEPYGGYSKLISPVTV